MVALMLHHPRMEAVGKTHNRLPLGVETFVADLLVTVHGAAQAGYYVRLVKDNPNLEQFINGWLNRARA